MRKIKGKRQEKQVEKRQEKQDNKSQADRQDKRPMTQHQNKNGTRITQAETLRRVLKLIRPYSFYLMLSFLLAMISVLLTLYVPILIGAAIDSIVAPGRVSFGNVSYVLIRFALTIAITALASWFMSLCNNRITFCVVKDVRKKTFDQLELLPIQYIDGHPHGDMLSRIVTDVDQLSEGLLMGFSQLFTGVVTIIGTLCFMISIHPLITIIVVCITPISFFVAGFIAKKTYLLFGIQSKIRGELTSLVEEMVGNQKVVQAFSYEEKSKERFREINNRLANCSVKAIFFSSLTNPCTRFVNGLVYTGVGIFGALLTISQGISVGQLSSFLNYANQYTKPFNEISGVITELQNALASAARVFELIDEPVLQPEDPSAIELEDVKGTIELKNVCFSYHKDRPLIENLNLSVTPGQRVAIVGPTGCGKTTIINLLMRFYDITSGSIQIDGHDIQELTRHSLYQNFGMVLQETWLKSTTVRENIAYGKPNATLEEVIQAAKDAHAHGFIKRLPKGYDTIISEDGTSISQGQKQLLCIARVMLKLPPILILDEATSSIDTRTEAMIQKAFQKMMRGRTSFIVAHRLSTIQEADIILVMKDGHIKEQGTHEELLIKKGFYSSLYESQYAKEA